MKFRWKWPRVASPVLRGDSIVEVVVATAILSSVMVATFSILQQAIDTNVNVRNRVIALNIAREGLEAVRNIRDTNWLKYSGNRRGKWLCLDTTTDTNRCDGSVISTEMINNANPATETFYTIDFNDANQRYFLVKTPGTQSNPISQYHIDFLAAQPWRESFRLYLTSSSPQRYTHTATGNTATPFYRQIYLDIDNPYDSLDANTEVFCGSGDTDDSCRRSRLKVISRVYWTEEGRQRSITLESHLFDFYERDEY